MLTPEYLKGAPELIVEQFTILEDEIARDIARQIKEAGHLSATSENQLRVLVGTTRGDTDARALINKYLKTTEAQLDDLLLRSGRITYNNDRQLYLRLKGQKLPPFSDNGFAQNITDAVRKQAQDELTRISQSMGMMTPTGPMPMADYYHSEINRAAFQISSGAYSYDDLIKQTIKNFGDRGIQYIDFASGASRGMEGHLRNVVLDATRQLSNQIGERNARDLGQDLMEISAHAGARPSHAAWQGELVSLSGRSGYLDPSDIGYGDVGGFGGANCRHSWYPYFEGSTRNYTSSELYHMANDTVTVDGREYLTYEAMAKQRAMERSIRKTQRRLVGFGEAEYQPGILAESTRLRRKMAELQSFTKAAGLKIDRGRLHTYGLGKGKITLPTRGPIWKNPRQGAIKQKARLKQAQAAVEQIAKRASVMDAQNFDDLIDYYSKAWEVSVHKNIKRLTFESVRETLAGFEDTLFEHPEAVQYFKEVRAGGRGMASINLGGELKLNVKTYQRTYEELQRAMEYSHKIGHSAAPTIRSVGRHESGHLLEASLYHAKSETYDSRTAAIVGWNNGAEAAAINQAALNEVVNAGTMTPTQAMASISNYGRTTPSEMLAEALASVTHDRATAGDFALAIIRLLKKELGRI